MLVVLLGLVGASGLATAIGGTAGGHGTATAVQPARAGNLSRAPVSEGVTAHEPFSSVDKSASASAGNLSVTARPVSPPPASGTSGQATKIEETGGITLVVKGAKIQSDLNRLAQLATADGGFVSNTQTQSAFPGSPAQGTITLQVPEANFDAVLAEVRGYGRVADLNTSANNVTSHYVDLQARINALQDSRQQYLTILAKAHTVGGVLAVQNQLQSLQSQLEQLQGQLKLLNSETTYATLAVTLTQKVVPPPLHHPEPGIVKAWNGAVSGFVGGFEGVLRVAGPLFFALLLLAALVLIGRWAWRFRPRRPSPPAAEAD